jgi:hypothetical protein
LYSIQLDKMRRSPMSSDDTLVKVKILLDHWIVHNQEHSEEFREWADKVKALAEVGAGDEMVQAAQEMEKASKHLSRALDKLGGRET